MSEEDTTKLKKVELKKWKKTKRKKKKPREEDFYLKITEGGKTEYATKVTKDEAGKGTFRVPPDFAKEIMEAVNAKNWNELELILDSLSENEVRFKIRKKSTYIV